MSRKWMRGLAAASAMVFAAAVAITPAEAARVYNFTPVKIGVMDPLRQSFVLQPGARSASLEWSDILPITVIAPQVASSLAVCVFASKHQMLVGGHYMVVSIPDPKTLSCSLCDSDHHQLDKRDFTMDTPIEDFTSGHVGC